VIFDNVLDKKRLRAIYAAVAGLFATLIPVIVAFNSGSSGAVLYGSFTNTEMVYAFNGLTRHHDSSVAFCEKLWMYPASLDPASVSDAEVHAIVDGLAGGLPVALGAARDSESPENLLWTDGTPWTRHTTDIEDIDRVNEGTLYVQADKATGAMEWRMSGGSKGTLCKGRLSQIKGAIPSIQNLARVPPVPKTACELTIVEREVIQRLMQRNTTCSYNMTLDSVIEAMKTA
jgi:hypothetical protein